MNDPKPDDALWQRMGQAWRAQPVPAVDVEALRARARRHGRRMWTLQAAEWVSAAVAVGVVVHVFGAQRQLGTAFVATVVGLLAVALGFIAWAAWARRRLLRATGLGPLQLVELEMGRARLALRYWRLNTRVTAAMCVVLVGALLFQPRIAAGDIAARGASVIVALCTFVAWLFERWRTRNLRADLRRLEALREALDR